MNVFQYLATLLLFAAGNLNASTLQAELSVRANAIGLWKNKQPIPPWE
jgi:hypothetical protein